MGSTVGESHNHSVVLGNTGCDRQLTKSTLTTGLRVFVYRGGRVVRVPGSYQVQESTTVSVREDLTRGILLVHLRRTGNDCRSLQYGVVKVTKGNRCRLSVLSGLQFPFCISTGQSYSSNSFLK